MEDDSTKSKKVSQDDLARSVAAWVQGAAVETLSADSDLPPEYQPLPPLRRREKIYRGIRKVVTLALLSSAASLLPVLYYVGRRKSLVRFEGAQLVGSRCPDCGGVMVIAIDRASSSVFASLHIGSECTGDDFDPDELEPESDDQE